MAQRTITADNPVLQNSKKERISGVKPINKEGKTKSPPLLSSGKQLEESTTVARPVSEVYAYWRDFTHLPYFCVYLRDVTVIDDKRSRWTVEGPAGKSLTWEASISEDRPNELIGWRSHEGSDFVNAGSVRFREAPGGRGTEISITFAYNPPGGAIGSLIAKLSGKEPAFLLREQIRRFKQLMETGEIPTIEGQPAVIEEA